ncbi:MAG: GNAT family N-acetyltransferase [Verrucomicrobia bacterium]|nr:GNAT family N-acetyltransferase [Verrucomicrobiota bacterium]
MESLDPLLDPNWDLHLGRHVLSTVFHSQGWARTLQETYGHRPVYCGLRDDAGISALLPMVEAKTWLTSRRGISLPFSDSCPPLGTVEDTMRLAAHVVDVGRKRGWRFIEFRDFPHKLLGGESSLSFKSHILDIHRPESAVLAGFEGSVRRAIRKAESSELDIHISQEAAAIRDYYDLHCLTRKRHGLFPQPSRFFASLHRNVIAKGGGFVTLAKKNERWVAGTVFLISGINACYKYGASDERFQALRGNNLVMWRSIQECQKRGCHSLDFGRTSADNEGLRRFKLSYGARENDLHYLRLDLRGMSADRLVDRSSGRVNSVIRLLPLWAARLAGEALYPHAS